MHTKVITYASDSDQINLTPEQIAKLEKAGVWPKDSSGREYCSVSHGLHTGSPSHSDEQLAQMVGLATL